MWRTKGGWSSSVQRKPWLRNVCWAIAIWTKVSITRNNHGIARGSKTFFCTEHHMVQHSTRTGFIGQVESPQYGEWKQLKVKIPLALQRSCCEGERISVPPSSFVHHPTECDAVQYEDDCEGCSLTTWRTRCQNRRQLSSQHHHLIQRDAFAGEHILCMVQVTFSRLANRLVVPSWQSTLRLTDHLLPVVSFSTQWLSKYYVCDSTAMWSYRMENTFCHAEAGSESLLAWKQSINNNSATFHKIFEL